MELQAWLMGDITTATAIISQVAMVTAAADFADALVLSMLAGFAVSLFHGLARGGRFDLLGFFLPLFIYLVGIEPRAALVITNERTGAIARIQDVPLAIAGPVHLITTAGHGLTGMMETMLGLTDTGLTADNAALVSVRAPIAWQEVLGQREVLGAAAALPGSGLDVVADTRNYVRDCVAPGLAKGLIDYQALTGGPIATALDTGWVAFVPTTTGASMACADLFAALDAGMADPAFADQIVQVMNRFYGNHPGDVSVGPRYRAALGAMVPDEAAFIRSVVWMQALSAGEKLFKGMGGAESASAALEDALIQRLQNNRGQAAIVFETLSATIGFIEAWSFGIMPVMLLVLVFGSLGLRLGAKYFWLLIWIQLWHPTILLVIDYMDARAASLPGAAADTIMATRSFLEQALRLEDIGYIMLSMATMLSMFLIYGTSAVFGTGLQQAMAGADHYDERKVYRDTLARAPGLAIRPSHEYATAGGAIGPRAAETFGDVRFRIDQTRAAGVELADLALLARGQSLQTGTALRGAETVTAQQGLTRTETAATTTSQSRDSSLSLSLADGVVNRLGGDQRTGAADQAQAGLSGSLQGTLGASKHGIGGSAALGTGFGHMQAEAHQVGLGSGSLASTDYSQARSETARTDTARSTGESTSRSDATSTARSDERAETRAETRSDSATRSTAETRATRLTEARAATVEVSGLAVAGTIAADPALLGDLERTVSETGIAPHVSRFMAANRDRLETAFLEADQRYAFAALYVMQGLGGWIPDRDADQMQALNALGDDIMARATFRGAAGSAHGSAAGPWAEVTGRVGAGGQAGPDIDGTIDEPAGFDQALRQARARIAAAPDAPALFDTLDDLVPQLARGLARAAPGAIDTLLAEARSRIDQNYAAILEDRTLLETWRSKGAVAMIRGLFENPAEQEQGALRRLYTGLDLPRGATPEDLLRAYEARTGLSTDTPVGAYLALSRLRAGALAAGDPDRAAALAARMETLAARHPGLAGEHGARIAMLALHSLRPNQQPMIADLASLEFRLGTSLARLRPPAALPYDEADLDQATRTVLGEAADQGPLGRQAVAHVIANRLRDDRWPDTVTAVVRQPRQFSAWNTDGSGNALVHLPASDPLYQQVRAEVRAVFDGQLPDPTGGAVHYYAPRGMSRLLETGHAQSPTPPWLATATAERNTPPVTIRDHVFTGQARD